MIARNLVLIAALLAATSALAQSRSGKHEIYLGPVFTDGKDYTFEGGSTARTDTGNGLVFGSRRASRSIGTSRTTARPCSPDRETP